MLTPCKKGKGRGGGERKEGEKKVGPQAKILPTALDDKNSEQKCKYTKAYEVMPVAVFVDAYWFLCVLFGETCYFLTSPKCVWRPNSTRTRWGRQRSPDLLAELK